ncbi:hypothetical protein TCK1_2822 [Pseudomonas monteilii]|uniref:Uncharacterized protein n=1 Tax=Pseudomonas monteilii TaxID=76759 RepID=A0AAE6RBT1_9PSED|nr:hypothetical protein TCK1_2822 [Pseudomonas monteilii]
MDFGDIKRRDTPGDRVMSTKYSEYAGSVYSQLHKSVQTEWEHTDKALVAKLLGQFGDPPKEL